MQCALNQLLSQGVFMPQEVGLVVAIQSGAEVSLQMVREAKCGIC